MAASLFRGEAGSAFEGRPPRKGRAEALAGGFFALDNKRRKPVFLAAFPLGCRSRRTVDGTLKRRQSAGVLKPHRLLR